MSDTVFVRILSGNMGDGWTDENSAAHAYAEWLETTKGVKTEVLENTSGVSGGSFDENGENTSDSNDWFVEWCDSKNAEIYIA